MPIQAKAISKRVQKQGLAALKATPQTKIVPSATKNRSANSRAGGTVFPPRKVNTNYSWFVRHSMLNVVLEQNVLLIQKALDVTDEKGGNRIARKRLNRHCLGRSGSTVTSQVVDAFGNVTNLQA